MLDVYNSLMYLGQPDFNKLIGAKPIRMIYESEILPIVASGDAAVVQWAAGLDPSILTCIDIESWPTWGTPDVVNATVGKLLALVNDIRRANPLLEFGFYNIYPVCRYWAPEAAQKPELDQIKATNELLRPLADACDVIFPSFYARASSVNVWDKFVDFQKAQTNWPADRVIPFLTPTYPPGSTQDSPTVQVVGNEVAFLEAQIDYVANAHGAFVVWGGYQQKYDPAATWPSTLVREVRKLRRM